MYLLIAVVLALPVLMLWSIFTVRPEQFVPVAFYRSYIYITPDTVGVLPPNETSFSGYVSNHDPGVWTMEAEVKLLRPVPMKSRGRRGFQRYGNANKPVRERATGTERGAEVNIRATRWDERNLRTIGWPQPGPGLPEYGIKADEAMPPEMLQRILPTLAQDILDQSGDQWLADAARVGGVKPPPLPAHRGTFAGWFPCIFLVLFIAAIVLMPGARNELRLNVLTQRTP